MRRMSLVPLLVVLAIAAAVPSTASAVGPPIVKTEAATSFFNTEATLNATVNPNGLATTYTFGYGTTAAYGSIAPSPPKAVGSGTSAVKVSEVIKGLKPNTTYHYTIWAENSAGGVLGEDRTFTTGRVTLVNSETKKPLAVGTTVHGEVELTFTSESLLSYCYGGNFNAVVAANPANPALLNQTGYLEFGFANKCDNPFGADWLTLAKESFKLGAKGPMGLGPMQLFSDGTANVDTDFDYVSFASSCSVEGAGSEKWKSSLAQPAVVELSQQLKPTGAGCFEMKMSGPIKLTTATGVPVEIIAQ